MQDPELQEAVELMLWALTDMRCPVCKYDTGHSDRCAVKAVHNVLNSRVPRAVSPQEPEHGPHG